MSKLNSINILLFTFIAVIIQITLASYLSFGVFKVDFICAMVGAFLVLTNGKFAISTAFFAGCVKELFSTHFFGIEILSLCVPAYIFSMIISKTDTLNFFVRFFLCFVFAFIVFSLYLTFLLISEKSLCFFSNYYIMVLPSSLYTSFFGSFIYYMLKGFVSQKSAQYELF